MMPDIHVAIPNYKRAGAVKTLDVVPFGVLWVPNSQADEYIKHYGKDKVHVIPDNLDGNIARKRNAILDNTPSPWVVMLDDDITMIGYWEGSKHFVMSPDQIREMLEHHYQLALDLGVTLWGINQNHDELIHYTYRPFSLLAPVLGPLHAHLETDIRYDESCPLREDYDFWLQTIQKYRKTLRANKYHYYHGHGNNPGGVVSQRTLQAERKSINRFIQKWGTKVVRIGGSAGGRSATGKNILNTRITAPIPGT